MRTHGALRGCSTRPRLKCSLVPLPILKEISPPVRISLAPPEIVFWNMDAMYIGERPGFSSQGTLVDSSQLSYTAHGIQTTHAKATHYEPRCLGSIYS